MGNRQNKTSGRVYGIHFLPIIIAVAIACSALASCKAHQSLVRERVVYDTVWSVKVVHDSIKRAVVEREITRIVPHIVRVGDTTIIYSDTIISRNTENNNYVYRNIYRDSGKVSRDSAGTAVRNASPRPQKTEAVKKHKWRLFWAGMILGVLITLAIVNRKVIVGFTKRFAFNKLNTAGTAEIKACGDMTGGCSGQPTKPRNL